MINIPNQIEKLTALDSLIKRIQYICKLHGASIFKSSPIEQIRDFVQQIDSSQHTAKLKFNFLFLGLMGRYPNLDDWQIYELYIQDHRYKRIAEKLLDSPEFLIVNDGDFNIEIVDLPDGTLVIDPTYSITFPYHTGIQRVVRSILKEYKATAANVKLVRYCTVSHRIELYKWDQDTAESWGKKTKSTKYMYYEKAKAIIGVENAITLVKIWRIVDEFRLKMKTFIEEKWLVKRKLKQKLANEGPNVQVPFLYKAKVLIPELIFDNRRLKTWAQIFTSLETKSTLISYDLIPIFYPEFCLVTQVFANHLTLLRYVDRTTCISLAIEDECKALMKGINRVNPNTLDIATHYLGANIKASASDYTPEHSSDNLPQIICVGTIEPRKNQKRIMMAAAQLMEQGLKFKLILVGNPGWLNEDMDKTLSYYQDKGYPIELRVSVTDAELKHLYETSKFTVYTSITEGFGLPIVESVVLGVPCLTSRRGCMLEIGSKIGGCHFVDPESIEDIAAGIKLLLTDAETYKKLKLETQNTKWLSWQDYASTLLNYSIKP